MDLFVVLVLAKKLILKQNFFFFIFCKKNDNFIKKCYNLIKKKEKQRGYGGMVDATDLKFSFSVQNAFLEAENS